MKKITAEKRKTAPLVAFILSILLVGLGQIINGQVKKGFIMLIISFVLDFIMFKTGFVYMEIVRLLIYLYAGYDAYKLTKTLKTGKEVSEFKFFY